MRGMILQLAIVAAVSMVFAGGASAQKTRASVSAAEVNGTYKMNFRGKFASFSNEVKLLALGRGRVRVAMDLVYPYTLRNGEPMVNMGTLDGEASIDADVAVYKSEGTDQCTITIRFVRPGTIEITQSESVCGFGHNVTADGTYKKISSRKPRFDISQ